MRSAARRKFVLVRIVEQRAADREGSKILFGQKINGCQIETEANFVCEIGSWAPMPGSGKKIFLVVIVIWRNSVECVCQTEPGALPVQNLTIPGVSAAEGMVRGDVPVEANTGIVARIIVALVEEIPARIQPVANARIVDCCRHARQQVRNEGVNRHALQSQ